MTYPSAGSPMVPSAGDPARTAQHHAAVRAPLGRGAGHGFGGRCRRLGIRRKPANARDRHPHGHRRGPGERARTRATAGARARDARCRARRGDGAGSGAIPGQSALRHRANGSTHPRLDDGLAAGSGHRVHLRARRAGVSGGSGARVGRWTDVGNPSWSGSHRSVHPATRSESRSADPRTPPFERAPRWPAPQRSGAGLPLPRT